MPRCYATFSPVQQQLTALFRGILSFFRPLSRITCNSSPSSRQRFVSQGPKFGPPAFGMSSSLEPSVTHKLRRSRLSLSPLRTLLTMPSLKYFSSPAAVLPPMYILSAPSTSRNPSVELSLPRRRGCWGMGMPRGDVTPRATADCDWAAAAACAAMPRDVDGAAVDTE